MTEYCACGHSEFDHATDPSHSGNTPCWESLDSQTDNYGYPINRCTCTEYQPVTA